VSVSVIIPSRLQRNPASKAGNLYLDKSVASVMRQTVRSAEVIVGLDEGMPVPPRFDNGQLIIQRSRGMGQARAMNAAVTRATGDWLAFLEDDDVWESQFLATALAVAASGNFAFVTSNQREVDEVGNFVGHNDFATPSGWLIRADVWRTLGGMDETLKWHVDTQFLGKANAALVRRCHIVEQGALSIRPEGGTYTEQHRRAHRISLISAHSALVEAASPEPLVTRTVNPLGGMGMIAKDPEVAAQSRKEHERIFAEFGYGPW
jgi:glycosyltransferase involved in cell wall biosynthesis